MTGKIGIIGTGRLGTMLVKALINHAAILPECFYLFNRTYAKAAALKSLYPSINLVQSSQEIIHYADWIFLCVKPLDLKDLLSDIGTVFPENKLIISTLLAPPLSELDKILNGKISRVYPSITQSTGRGVSLLAFGRQVTETDKAALIDCLSLIGKAIEIPEEHFRVCGDITSCGPAFMAYMIGSLAAIAEKHGIAKDMAAEMARETMLGTALLLEEQNLSFDELVCQVATPGGCTAKGIDVLSPSLPAIVQEVFTATARREEEVRTAVMKALQSN